MIFHESRSEVVARLVVLLRNEGLSEDAAVLIAETLAQNENALLNTVIEKELGLSADVNTVPWKDAFAMGASFFLGAAVPIIPYLIAAFNMMPGMVAVWTSILGTAVGLFLMGAGKTRFTLRNPVTSGLEMLAIGVVSAVLGLRAWRVDHLHLRRTGVTRRPYHCANGRLDGYNDGTATLY